MERELREHGNYSDLNAPSHSIDHSEKLRFLERYNLDESLKAFCVELIEQQNFVYAVPLMKKLDQELENPDWQRAVKYGLSHVLQLKGSDRSPVTGQRIFERPEHSLREILQATESMLQEPQSLTKEHVLAILLLSDLNHLERQRARDAFIDMESETQETITNRGRNNLAWKRFSIEYATLSAEHTELPQYPQAYKALESFYTEALTTPAVQADEETLAFYQERLSWVQEKLQLLREPQDQQTPTNESALEVLEPIEE